MLFNCLSGKFNEHTSNKSHSHPTSYEEDRPRSYTTWSPRHTSLWCVYTWPYRRHKYIDFKKFQYDVLKLHAAFDSLVSQLMVNKAAPSDLNQMIYLLQAYKMNISNKTFLCHVDNLELDWSQGVINTPAELRDKVETYISTLIRNKQWKSTHSAPFQPTALLTNETIKTGTPGKQTDDKDAITKLKAKNAAWKFDHSKSSTKTHTKNNKTYHWCTGPGHSKIGMWVIHEPGTCTGSTKGKGTGTPQANTAEIRTATSRTQGNHTKKATFKAHIVQVLASANAFGNDTSDLINKIIAEYKWLLSQRFSLMWLLYWPFFFGFIVPTLITILMSIYYYPPPLLIYLGYGSYTLYCYLPLPLFLMHLHWTHPYWPNSAASPVTNAHQVFKLFLMDYVVMWISLIWFPISI